MARLSNVLSNSLGNSLANVMSGAGSTYQTILGSNLRALWDSRYNASTSTWTDTVSGIAMSGSNSPALAAISPYYNGNPVFAFNGTNQAFDTGTLLADIVPAVAKPYMWFVGRAVTAPGGGASTRMVSIRTPGIEEQLGIGDPAGTKITAGSFTGSVNVGTSAAPQAFPSFWEIFYDTNGARSVYRDGVLVATGAVGVTTNAIRRVQIGGRPDASNNYANCTVAQLGICTSVPTTAQRAALKAQAITDWDTGPKTVATVLGANLSFRIDSLTSWSAAAWVDQVASLSLTGTGTPTRGADGTNFRGKNVISFNGTNQGYSGSAGSDICATSTRPYIYLVMRELAGSASTTKVLQTYDAGAANEVYGIGDTAGTTTSLSARIESQSIGTVNYPITAPSFWEVYLDSSGVRSFARDGSVIATFPGAISTTHAIRTVSVGAAVNTVQWSSCRVAEVVICTSLPSSTTRGLLQAISQEQWGTP